MSQMYTPPAIFSTLHPVVGTDFVLTFSDGIVLLHSSVIRRFSPKLTPLIDEHDGDSGPHNMDIRSHRKIVGLIIKDLLYQGIMTRGIAPETSKLSRDQRLNYLREALDVCHNLGFTCLFSTLKSWIAKESDQPVTEAPSEPGSTREMVTQQATVTAAPSNDEQSPQESSPSESNGNGSPIYQEVNDPESQMNDQDDPNANGDDTIADSEPAAAMTTNQLVADRVEGFINNPTEPSTSSRQLIEGLQSVSIKEEPRDTENIESPIVPDVTNEDDFVCCNFCNESFPDEGQVKLHLKIHLVEV